mgnify:CR=1 FL=1
MWLSPRDMWAYWWYWTPRSSSLRGSTFWHVMGGGSLATCHLFSGSVFLPDPDQHFSDHRSLSETRSGTFSYEMSNLKRNTEVDSNGPKIISFQAFFKMFNVLESSRFEFSWFLIFHIADVDFETTPDESRWVFSRCLPVDVGSVSMICGMYSGGALKW